MHPPGTLGPHMLKFLGQNVSQNRHQNHWITSSLYRTYIVSSCQLVLREQINEQAMYLDDLTYGLTLLDSGWQLNNGKIKVKWFDGEQVLSCS